jgi:phosphoserine phosphatase
VSLRGLVAFDLDGTLVRIWSAWSWIHRLLGSVEAAKPNADLYYAGKIDYIEWANRDVELWHGVPLQRIEDAIEKGLVFIPNTRNLIKTLHGYGLKTAIISSGLSIFASRAKNALDMDFSRANTLITDEEGRICGVEVHVAFDNKDQVMSEIAQNLGLSLDQCVAVGDSRNDIPMFQIAGFSVAFNPTNEEVAQAATRVIKSEDAMDLLSPLREFYELE